jgi:hypothetical protein
VTRPTLRFFLALIATALAAAPALAQPVPPLADRMLWCASAFYWLATNAADAGEIEESEMYDGWSNRLMELGSGVLTEAGFAPERIAELIDGYDEAALVQLADDTAAYEVTRCPDLVGGNEPSEPTGWPPSP